MPDHDPTPLDQAIDAAEAKARAQMPVAINLLLQAHRWQLTNDAIVHAPDDPEQPALLFWDPAERAYRPVLLPPGSDWHVAAAAAASGRIVIPGRPT